MEDESFKATSQEKRLKILASDEIKSIYSRPHFNNEERIEYFALSHADLEILEGFRSLKSQVHFILQLGYFRAKYLFFVTVHTPPPFSRDIGGSEGFRGGV